MVRVIVVDDEVDARALLRVHLERLDRYEVVGEAGDVINGIDLAAHLAPDVIVLDERLPGGPGHDAIPTFRSLVATAKIVVWSSSPAFRYAAMTAGADLFLDKLDGATKWLLWLWASESPVMPSSAVITGGFPRASSTAA